MRRTLLIAIAVAPCVGGASAQPPAEPAGCDILVEPGLRSATNDRLWPGGVVPYTFDESVPSQFVPSAMLAMAIIEGVCDVDFVERTDEANWIDFRDAPSNGSFVGMVGGEQEVRIASWPFEHVIVHELMHALGIWHEHQRPDRDEYVEVIEAHVVPSALHNFEVAEGARAVGPYDFESVMHYGDEAFSNGQGPTILPLPEFSSFEDVIGQRTRLSEGDTRALRALYGAVAAPADIDGDGAVGASDLAFLIGDWGRDRARSDLDGDGVVGSSDLGVLLGAWG